MAAVGVQYPTCRRLGYRRTGLGLGEPAPQVTMSSLPAQLRGDLGYQRQGDWKTNAIRPQRTNRLSCRPVRQALLRIVSFIFSSCTLFGDFVEAFGSNCRKLNFLHKPAKNKAPRKCPAALDSSPGPYTRVATSQRLIACLLSYLSLLSIRGVRWRFPV